MEVAMIVKLELSQEECDALIALRRLLMSPREVDIITGWLDSYAKVDALIRVAREAERACN